MRARLIVNPYSGVALWSSDVRVAIAELAAAGWDVDVAETTGPGDATRLAREAIGLGFDAVLAAGGDGTVNEAAQPLVGTDVALGVVPVGTANMLARQLGFPLDVAEAARALGRSVPQRIDVGLAGDRYFLLWAGIGFDAEVARHLEPNVKRTLGVPAIVVASFWTGLWFEGARTELTIDDLHLDRRTLLTVVANAGLYALMELSDDAQLDDGLLDVVIFEGSGPLTKLKHFVNLLLRRHRDAEGIEFHRARRVQIAPRRPMPVQLDGEPIGFTPVRISLVPHALNVLAPARP